MPGTVAGGTVKVPLALIASPASPPLATSVGTTSAGKNGAAFNVSLLKTVAVFPPPAPIGVAEKLSFTALISVSTTIITFAVSQLVRSAVSQIW